MSRMRARPRLLGVNTFAGDSDLVSQIAYKSDSSTTLASVVRTFEPHRDLIASVENKWDRTTVSKFEYTNDALGRRTSVTVSGTAFSAAGTTGFDLFGYNDRNELTSARRYAGGTISSPTDPVYARHFEYEYDPIGNRETYEVSQGTATSYTTNELNQYTATENPSESFTYDDDGNLTQDGTYTYVWDAENRLIEAYPTNPTTGSQKCVMVYDYMNRRVKRSLHDWTGSAWAGTPAEARIFLYDGWNVLLTYNPEASMAIDREFTWGLDLSGLNGGAAPSPLDPNRDRQGAAIPGMHAAGGIGGLVAARGGGPPTKAYFCFYDANGNLSDCVKNSDGTLWTHVEYDPYGGPIVASDAGGLGHPFRYSTKYWEGVVEKYYFGQRYLDYRLGRWTSRDRIEEADGPHLTKFVRNAATHYVDAVGLFLTNCTDWWGGTTWENVSVTVAVRQAVILPAPPVVEIAIEIVGPPEVTRFDSWIYASCPDADKGYYCRKKYRALGKCKRECCKIRLYGYRRGDPGTWITQEMQTTCEWRDTYGRTYCQGRTPLCSAQPPKDPAPDCCKRANKK